MTRSTWNAALDQRQMRQWMLLLGVLVASILVLAPLGSGTSASAPDSSVIVQAAPNALAAAEQAVRHLGGSVGRSLPIVNGFVADIPADEVDRLSAMPGVRAVSPNRTMRPTGLLDGWDQGSDLGSMNYAAQVVTGAGAFWNAGITGRGVDVALIDSGVAPVNGLRTVGKVLNWTGLLVRVTKGIAALLGHVRARHPSGGHHRRARRLDARDRPARRADVRRHGAGRPHRQSQGGRPDGSDRRLPGARGDRLGRAAPQHRRAEHPGAQPLVRHRQHAGLPS